MTELPDLSPTRVYLEVGKRWTFACALDWPGWARRAKDVQAALDAMMSYAPRYAVVAGPDLSPGQLKLEVIGQVEGNATTDFGAPSAIGAWDEEVSEPAELERLAELLSKTWLAFDETVAAAPALLRKGPRGGGRDRDAIADHVREAERTYGSKIGVRIAPGTPWPDQRLACLDALRAGAPQAPWPASYAIRRLGWHVMDHVWEIEDRSQQLR